MSGFMGRSARDGVCADGVVSRREGRGPDRLMRQFMRAAAGMVVLLGVLFIGTALPTSASAQSGTCPDIGTSTIRYSAETDTCSTSGSTPTNPGFSITISSSTAQATFDGKAPDTVTIVRGEGCQVSGKTIQTRVADGSPRCTVMWTGRVDGRDAVVQATLSGGWVPASFNMGMPIPPFAFMSGANSIAYIIEGAPSVVLLTVDGAPTRNADSLSWRVIFDRVALKVTADDFALTTTGTATGTIATVTGADAAWTVTVQDVAGEGTLRVDLRAETDITDQNGYGGGNKGYTPAFTGIPFSIDRVAPAAPVIANPADGAVFEQTTPTITGTTEPGSTVAIMIGGIEAGTATADGAGAWNFTPAAPLAFGAHVVTATATDAAGNISTTSAALSFTVAAPIPDAPVISGDARRLLAAPSQPQIEGTATAGSTVIVRVNGQSAGTATADGSGNWSHTLGAALERGTYAVTAVAANATDGVSEASNTIDLAVLAPTVVVSPAQGGLADRNPAVLTGTAEPGVTIVVATLLGSSYGQTTADASGEWSFTMPSEFGGGGRVIIHAQHDWGYLLPAPFLVFRVDVTPPAAPVIASPADGALITETAPTFTGTAEARSTVTVLIDGIEVGTVTADGARAWSFTPAAPLAFGDRVVTATATDQVGNVSAVSASVSFTVAEPIPDAPVITGDAQRVAVAPARPQIAGTAAAGSTVTVLVDGASAGTTTANGSGDWSLTLGAALERGTYAVTAVAANTTGGVSGASNTIDLAIIAPTVILSPANGGNADRNPAVLTGTAEPGVTIMVWSQGARDHYGDVTVDASGDWSFTMPSQTTSAFRLQVYTQHAWGALPFVPSLFRVDIVAPDAPVIASPADGAILTETTPTITGTAEAGSQVELFADGASLGATTVDESGGWAFTPGAPLDDGTYAITATATDRSDNVSAASAPIHLTVDATAPDAPVIIAPADGAVLDHANPILTGTAEAAAKVELFIDGASVGTVTADGAGAWSFTVLDALADGAYALTAVATDAVGNASAASVAVNFTINTIPPDVTPPSVIAMAVIGAPALTADSASWSVSFDESVQALVTGDFALTTTGTASGTIASVTGSGTDWTVTVEAIAGEGSLRLDLRSSNAVIDEEGNGAGVNGHVSAFTGEVHAVDRVAPDAPVITSPADGASVEETRPTISGTAEIAATVTLLIDNAEIGTTTVDGSGDWSFRPDADLAFGAYTLAATATDAAGNASVASAAIGFTVVESIPDAPVISGASRRVIVATATPEITGTAPVGSTVTVLIDGQYAGTTTADASGGWSFQLAARLERGTYAVTATAANASGGVSQPSAVIDLAVIAPTVVVSPQNGLGADRNPPVLIGTAEPGVTVAIKDLAGSVTHGQVTVDASGDWSFTLPPPPTPRVGLSIHTQHAWGGVGSFQLAFGVDLVAPDAPVITSPADGDMVFLAAPVITGATEPYVTVELFVGGASIGTTTSQSDGEWSFTPAAALADGVHVLTAKATDQTGNVSPASAPVSFTIDTMPPGVVSIAIDGAPAPAAMTVDWIVSFDEAVLAVVANDFALTTTGMASGRIASVTGSGTDWTVTVEGIAGEGTLRPDLKPDSAVTDATGNGNGTNGHVAAFTGEVHAVDRVAPDAPVVTAPVDGATTAETTPTITGTAEANATVELFINGASVGTATADGSGSWSFALTTALADGEHAVTATATDAAGNVSGSSTGVTFTIRSLMLEGGDLEAATAGVTYAASLTATGIVTPLSHEIVSGRLPVGLELSADGRISGVPTAGGSFAFTVRAGYVDAASQAGTVTADYRLMVGAPTITVSPDVLSDGRVASPYAEMLTASGGVAPHVEWRVIDGRLPDGLALSSEGVLEGTPEISGAFTFTVSVRDSATGEGPYEGRQAFTLNIDAPPPPEVTPPAPLDVPPPAGANGSTVTVSLGAHVAGMVEGFRIVAPPTNGHASIETEASASAAGAASGAPQFRYLLVYEPDAGFMGADQVELAAFGPGGESPAATFVFHVAGKAPDLQAEVVSDASVRLQPTEGLTGGPFTSLGIITPPAYGEARTAGLEIVFTPGADNGGETFLEYVIHHGHGISAPGRIDLVSHLAVEVQALTAQSLAGLPVTVRITDNVRGGPFTSASVTSVAPLHAGEAVIHPVEGGYDLTYTPQGAFDGEVVITYVLGNAHSSATSTLTVTVEARPDPSLDPDVRGLASSQIASAQRFTDAQVGNFQRRLEALRRGENPASHNVSLNFGFARDDRDRDPRAALARDLRSATLDPGARPDPEQEFLGLDIWADRRREAPADTSLNAAPRTRDAAASGVSVWTAGSIDWGRQDATGQRDFRFRTNGLTIGMDGRLGDRLIVGGGLGYGHDRTEIGENGSLSTARNVSMALYGSWRITDAIFLDGVTGYGDLAFTSRRWATGLAGEADAFAHGEREGEVWFMSGTIGRMADRGALKRSLYVRTDVRAIRLDPFTETGAGLASLDWDAVSEDSLSATLGALWNWRFDLRDRGLVAPYMRLEWSYAFRDVGDQGVRYADWAASPTYLTRMHDWSRNALNLDLGAEWTLHERLMLSLGYRGRLGSASHSHGADIGFVWRW